MKFLRILLRIILGLLVAILLFLAISVSPNDHTPYQQTDFYSQTTARLAALPGLPIAKTAIRAGWAKANLTPAFTTPTGGYGVRKGKHWTTVADSVWVRAIVFDNGNGPVAMVASDLLITPPTVSDQLRKRLPEIGLSWESVYFGAIHSHNSLGGWAPGLVGNLFSGSYDQRVVDHITNTILAALKQAKADLQPVEIGYKQVNAPEFVYNRLDEKNPVDPFFRLLRLKRADGKTATMVTYPAHATMIDIFSYQYLSRDWPGRVVDGLERETGGFAVFLAGAVGSMGPKGPPTGKDFPLVNQYAANMMARLKPELAQFQTRPDSTLGLLTLPLSLRDPAPRVLGDWRIRPWLFHAVYGDYPSDLKALRIGPALLIGAPCDFSGELLPPLMQAAKQQRLDLMVTSFNGGYVGYITPDAYYEKDAYETRVMNWFGPQNGAYFSEMITGLVRKAGR
ncbi:neutral/alkaline non-lysosomal ceramidase N-terminal domain-containing protein [Fibrella forsythiae]|uniref:Neutral/alkaline non-lysosomal ceramidase N-terminal domain-containing protein n=1 Tax=Fibrella forsythiae TaxID=2817061 RepID=A0ABS3JN87_9BACT|nr:neutral/alkaline non-lysosomal ceramidase N-terminal domain-containing protein [Fibrella forsythiae]MBO0951473.1 neutral/alkaline non-lysosomal ceramidase N-terminal domain-containing protein [Fibrella forsythiae]